MKHVFATILVLVALVTVFHPEKITPIPRAVGVVMNSTMVRHMPFGIQAAYAESCISDLEADQDHIRYSVSDATVRLAELDHRIAGLRKARDQSVARIRLMVGHREEASVEAVGKEVARHDDLQWKLTQAEETRDQLSATLQALEAAEGSVSQKVAELNDRLDVLQFDHELNNGRELADSAYHGRRNPSAHCSKVIEYMEHRERVRAEMHRRYDADPTHTSDHFLTDPRERARQIADG